MAPKKKSTKKNKSEKNELPKISIVEETTIDIDQLNHLNTLYDSGSNGFRCTATEISNPNHGSIILEAISRMRQERLLSDLTLSTKNKSHYVHKVVMAACSDYFCNMLKKDPSVQCVDVNDVSPLGLTAAITYAYTGTLSLSLYTIGCTIATATQFQMYTLINLCTDFLIQEMNVENCMYISNIAGTYGLKPVKESVKKFIRENFLEFSENDQFMKLTYDQISDLLMDDCLQLPSELTAFQIAMKWLQFDSKRVKQAADLLSNIRFGTISAHDLVSYVQPIPCMMQDPDCHRLLVNAMNYHLLPHQQNLMQSRRTKLRGGQKVLVTIGGRPALTEKALSREIVYRDPENGWNKLAEMPAKSFNQCVVVMDGFLYVAGGEDQNDARNQAKHAVSNLSRYDPRFNTWFHLSSMLQKRTHFSMCAYNGLLFALGGRNLEGPLATVECYIPSSNQWQIKAPMEVARCCHASALNDGQILISGGYINNGYSRTVCTYDPTTEMWKDRAGLSTPRGWHCSVTLGDYTYVMGGSQLGPHGERVDVLAIERYSACNGQWSHVAPLSIGVSTAGATTLNDRIYLVGGWNESTKKYKNCIQIYNPDLNEWTEEDELPEATVGVSCCTIMLPNNKLRESRASSVASAAISI